VAVVTNIAPNHLDWHTDMEEYVEAKRNLLAYQTAADRVVLNADNAYTAAFAATAKADVWQFSRREKPQTGAFLDENGTLCISDNGAVTPILPANEIRILGVHNVENYLAAFAAVWGAVPPAVMADYARTFGGVAHRCEWVRTLDGVPYYNDSIGSSPSRTIAGLRAFDRKVILIAGGYDKHIPYAPLGEVMPETVKYAILLGATAQKIEDAVKAVAPDFPLLRVADLPAAVAAAREYAKDGDIVFFSPASASFDMYKNFEERGKHFCALVNQL
jgi:UDP-N-acetylmuramoylalanine--D-glutamate ligase